jgi:hypothetical protein
MIHGADKIIIYILIEEIRIVEENRKMVQAWFEGACSWTVMSNANYHPKSLK